MTSLYKGGFISLWGGGVAWGSSVRGSSVRGGVAWVAWCPSVALVALRGVAWVALRRSPRRPAFHTAPVAVIV